MHHHGITLETAIATQNERFIQQRYDDFAVGNIPAVLAVLARNIHSTFSVAAHFPTTTTVRRR
jgi:hypothetical protein